MIWIDERRRVERLQVRAQFHRAHGERLRGVLKERTAERMAHTETLAWLFAAGALWGSRQRKVPVEDQERHPILDLVAVSMMLSRWSQLPAKIKSIWHDVQSREEELRAQRRGIEDPAQHPGISEHSR